MPEQPPSWRRYDAPGDDPDDVPQPEHTVPGAPPSVGDAPFVPYGSPQHGSASSVPPLVSSSGRSGPALGAVVVAGFVAVVALGGAVMLFAVSGDGDGNGVAGALDADAPDMHSQEGLDELIAELEDDAGTTEVYSLTLYPGYAVVNVYAEGGNGNRYDGYYFDGSLDDWGPSSTSTDPIFDLKDLDASMFDRFCAKAEKLIEDHKDCYITVAAPGPEDPDAGWYSAYISNDYGEGGYIKFDLEGKEVFRTVW